MSFQPYDRNPSGIVFFGTSASDKLYESVSTFTYDAAQNSLRLPNGGYIGTQGDFDSISIASNGNVTLSQSLSIAGNLTVNGTTTTVNSTTVTVEDPIIFLGSGAPTTDDNLDRGIAFNWHTGSVARSGFFGFDDSIQGFTFIPIATGLGGNVVTGGGAGWAVFAGVSGALAGNATTATTLQNSRTFSVSGQTLASAQSFDGSANVTLTTALDKSAITSQPENSTVDTTADYFLFYDASNSGLARCNVSQIITAASAEDIYFNVWDTYGYAYSVINQGVLNFQSGVAISFYTHSPTDTPTVSGILNRAVAGNGLNMTNQVLAVGAGSGITVGADQVSVTDGSGILVDANGVHANLISYAVQTVAANAATTAASRTYPIQVDSSDKLVVNVPWSDTGMSFSISDGTTSQTINNTDTINFRSGPAINFTVSATDQVSGTLNSAVAGNGLNMTSQVLAVGAGSGITVGADQVSVNAGSGLSLDANGVHVNAGTGLLNTAAGLQIGVGNGITGAADAISVTDGSGILVNANGVHANLVSYTVQTEAAQGVTTTASRTYSVQVNGSDQLVVNVPWVDTNTTYTAGTGLSLNGTTFNLASTAAGSGLAISDNAAGVLHIDLNEYSSVAIASGDRLFTLDSNNATEQLTTIVDLGQFMAGNGLVDNGAGSLAVNVDNSTVEINTDILRIRDSGVTEVKRSRTTAAVSSNVTLSSDINLCTAGAGGITVTLPTVITGKMVYVKKVDSAAGTVTISRGGSSTIDGANTVVLYHQWEALHLVSDGTNWFIV